jgi:hypothetical protein
MGVGRPHSHFIQIYETPKMVKNNYHLQTLNSFVIFSLTKLL